MTLREKIEFRAREDFILFHPVEEREEAAQWWDSTGNDTMKEDSRSTVLEKMLDEEI